LPDNLKINNAVNQGENAVKKQPAFCPLERNIKK
jgi:hypothetical protein